jgi:group II intron maturase
VVNLKEAGASLDFLGFTFRYYDDLKGQGWRYLNVSPSAKALKKEREKLHEMTNHRQCFKPIPQRIAELNRHLEGWKNYFEQPTALPAAGRSQLLRADPAFWAGAFMRLVGRTAQCRPLSYSTVFA